MIGLSYRAGKLRFGTESVIESVRGSNKPFVVIEASDVSDNTHKRLSDGCTYHGVRLIKIKEPMIEFGNSIGGRGEVSCAAITDKGFAARITELADNSSTDGMQQREEII